MTTVSLLVQVTCKDLRHDFLDEDHLLRLGQVRGASMKYQYGCMHCRKVL